MHLANLIFAAAFPLLALAIQEPCLQGCCGLLMELPSESIKLHTSSQGPVVFAPPKPAVQLPLQNNFINCCACDKSPVADDIAHTNGTSAVTAQCNDANGSLCLCEKASCTPDEWMLLPVPTPSLESDKKPIQEPVATGTPLAVASKKSTADFDDGLDDCEDASHTQCACWLDIPGCTLVPWELKLRPTLASWRDSESVQQTIAMSEVSATASADSALTSDIHKDEL